MRDAMKIAKKNNRLAPLNFDPVNYIIERNRIKGYPFCEYDVHRIKLDLKHYYETRKTDPDKITKEE